jgi:hypothetical protein
LIVVINRPPDSPGYLTSRFAPHYGRCRRIIGCGNQTTLLRYRTSCNRTGPCPTYGLNLNRAEVTATVSAVPQTLDQTRNAQPDSPAELIDGDFGISLYLRCRATKYHSIPRVARPPAALLGGSHQGTAGLSFAAWLLKRKAPPWGAGLIRSAPEGCWGTGRRRGESNTHWNGQPPSKCYVFDVARARGPSTC